MFKDLRYLRQINFTKALTEGNLGQIRDFFGMKMKNDRRINCHNDRLMEKFIETGASLEYRKTNLSVEECRVSIADILIKRGMSADLLMDWASLKGYLELVKLFIERGAKVNDELLSKWFYNSIKSGNISLINFFIEKGVKLNQGILDNCLYGANINNSRIMPYMCMPHCGNLENIKYLISKGANVSRMNDNGLYDATFYGKIDIVKFLLENGANPNNKLSNGMTPLYGASIVGGSSCFDCAKLLLEYGADCNIPDDNWGVTPVHVAIGKDKIELVKLYLNNPYGKKADLTLKNKLGKNAFDFVYENPEMYKLLEENSITK